MILCVCVLHWERGTDAIGMEFGGIIPHSSFLFWTDVFHGAGVEGGYCPSDSLPENGVRIRRKKLGYMSSLSAPFREVFHFLAIVPVYSLCFAF